MERQWLEFESFRLYPAASQRVSCRVDATLLDIASGAISSIRGLTVHKDPGDKSPRIADEPPWDAMPADERAFIETRLDAACRKAGCNIYQLDRPEMILPLPRVRHIIPEVGKPGHDKEVDHVEPPFVPPFEQSWEKLFDGELAEPSGTAIVFAGIETDVIGTVRALGEGLRVLDIGCSAGYTGEQAKRLDPTIEWIGLDIVPAAVKEAEVRLDAAHLIDIERDPIPYPEGHFDVAVCSQLLEHLYNPWAAARTTAAHLKDGGTMICSVPHAGHVAVLAQLIQGRYPLSSSGPLDITHLRTFTAETLLQLVQRAGCQPVLLTKSMFRMTRTDEKLMQGILEAAQNAGLDYGPYIADGWAVGFTVVARKQHVTVADRTSLVRRAERAQTDGQPDRARRMLDLETLIHPQNALAFIRLAGMLRAGNDHNGAAKTLARCVKLHPAYLPARYELIRTICETGDKNEAITEFERAVEIDTNFFLPLQALFA
jgi:2-polyprenyl-3-methyl-5-hydroxy-6-metoxy-1,4-benzoquinol methylase